VSHRSVTPIRPRCTPTLLRRHVHCVGLLGTECTFGGGETVDCSKPDSTCGISQAAPAFFDENERTTWVQFVNDSGSSRNPLSATRCSSAETLRQRGPTWQWIGTSPRTFLSSQFTQNCFALNYRFLPLWLCREAGRELTSR